MNTLGEIFDELILSFRNDPAWQQPLESATVLFRNNFFDDDPMMWDDPLILRAWVLGFLSGLPRIEFKIRDELALMIVLRRYDELLRIGAAT